MSLEKAGGIGLSAKGIQSGKLMVELGKLRTQQIFGDTSEETRNWTSEIKAIMPDREELHEKRYFDQGLFYASELVLQMCETTKESTKGAAVGARGAFALGKISLILLDGIKVTSGAGVALITGPGAGMQRFTGAKKPRVPDYFWAEGSLKIQDAVS
jgi:hypothetical protein